MWAKLNFECAAKFNRAAQLKHQGGAVKGGAAEGGKTTCPTQTVVRMRDMTQPALAGKGVWDWGIGVGAGLKKELTKEKLKERLKVCGIDTLVGCAQVRC